MGLYLSVPGADYSASAAKLGTQTFLAEDPLPFLALPGLVNWWRAEDAVQTGGITSIKDRVAGASLSAASGAASPTPTTVSGKIGLSFDGGDQLTGAAYARKDAYTWLIVHKAQDTALATSCFLAGTGTSPINSWYQFTDGTVKARNFSGQPQSTAGKIVAGATKILGMSFDPVTHKYGFSFDGVFDKYIDVSSVQAGSENASTAFSVGADSSGGNKLTGTLFDIYQFDRDYHAAGNAAYFAWVVSKLKTRYGL